MAVRLPGRNWEAECEARLRKFFEAHPTEVFYMKQVEVFFERWYVHWLTAGVLNELIAAGFLKSDEIPLRPGSPIRVKFIWYHALRSWRRKALRMLKVVQEYSSYEVAEAYGRQAEHLFIIALAERGFGLLGRHVNEFGGVQWTTTNHNLDMIMQRDGVVYGCEVKNTWDYINRKELQIKIMICRHLKIRPLFIMRYAPQTYLVEDLLPVGGVWSLFEAQVYPYGMESLAQRVRDILNLAADTPSRIPDGIIDRFLRVHGRVLTGEI